MKNKLIRRFAVTLAAVLCMAAFSVTAYAGGVDPDPEPLPETTEAPLPEETEEPTTGGIEMEPEGVPVTPKGNAALVDDFFGDKQLITVTTKAGNYFYILIEQEPQACTCTAKCEAGAVNTACPVCKNNLTACAGPEPEPVGEEEPAAPEKESGGMGGLVVFLVVALAGGGVALYFFKLRKPKADVKGGDDLDEYDFGEAEGDEEEAPEPDDATDGYAQEPGEDLLMEEETDEEDEE